MIVYEVIHCPKCHHFPCKVGIYINDSNMADYTEEYDCPHCGKFIEEKSHDKVTKDK